MSKPLETLHAWELPWIIRFQGDGTLHEKMHWLSYPGWESLIYVLPFVYYFFSARYGVSSYFLFYGSTGVLDSLKLAFQSPRPYWIEPGVQALSGSGSYSFPSGHVFTATVVWGFLALRSRDWIVWVLAATLILLVSVSRVYLGVHFFSDVVAGWLFAAAILILYSAAEGRVWDGWRQLYLWQQLGAIVLTLLMFVGQGALVRWLTSGAANLGELSQFAGRAGDASLLFASAGGLFGTFLAAMGCVRLGVEPPRRGRWKIVCLGYAFAGLFLLQNVSQWLPHHRSAAVAFLILFAQPAATTFWILFVTPWLFGQKHPVVSSTTSSG